MTAPSKQGDGTPTHGRVARGFCLNCGHSPDAHDDQGVCEVEVSDYGNLDCSCDGLRMCAACDGDPEAHGLHVCGRDQFA